MKFGNRKKYDYDDFTETMYRKCLLLAKEKYTLIPFDDYRKDGKNCLWRHDIDYSPHRALRMAEIESEEKIRSTFFVSVHSNAYNFFEKEIFLIIKSIQSMGHHIGLHFDFDFYTDNNPTKLQIKKFLLNEKKILEDHLRAPIKVFSFHNPTLMNYDISDEIFAGMINVYSQYIKNNYSYISDSSCYWRFRRLKTVLEEAEDQKLLVLTHPVCWTAVPMSPYKRFLRTVNGRRRSSIRYFQSLLKTSNRKIIK